MKKFFKIAALVVLASLVLGAISSPLSAGERRNKFSFSLNLNSFPLFNPRPAPVLRPAPVPVQSYTYVETYRPYVQERTVVREYYYPSYPQGVVYSNPYQQQPYHKQVMVDNPPQVYERVVVNPRPWGY